MPAGLCQVCSWPPKSSIFGESTKLERTFTKRFIGGASSHANAVVPAGNAALSAVFLFQFFPDGIELCAVFSNLFVARAGLVGGRFFGPQLGGEGPLS